MISITPGNNDVTDTSDDGDDTDGNTINDATVVLFKFRSIEVTKTAVENDTNSNGKTKGDIIVYNITVRIQEILHW